MQPKVSIIVSNWNGATITYNGSPILKRCLDSLRRTAYKNHNMLLTDDASTDNSVEFVRKNYPHIRVLANKTNVGYARNNNRAINYALRHYAPEYILLLNNDIIITDTGWLSKMVKAAESDPKVAVEGCKLLYPDGRIQHGGIIFKNSLPITRGRLDPGKKYGRIESADAVIGAVFLMRVSAMEKIGLLDNNFYRGPDDVDFSIRARKHGYRVLYNGKVSLIHLEGSTFYQSSQEVRDRSFYKRLVGRTYFAFKDIPFPYNIKVLLTLLLGSVFTMEAGDRSRGLPNLRLRDRIIWRLRMYSKATSEAHKLYKEYKRSPS